MLFLTNTTSTRPDDWILDPFSGSGTTGIAASLLDRNYCGIEMDVSYCELAKKRREEIVSSDISSRYREKIYSVIDLRENTPSMVCEDEYRFHRQLPF